MRFILPNEPTRKGDRYDEDEYEDKCIKLLVAEAESSTFTEFKTKIQ